jgi:hypothetical protein
MNPLLGPIEQAEHREVGGAEIDIVRVGSGRVGRVVYPPGFRWSKHIKPMVGTDLCRHAHVGFLAQGHIQGSYADGCAFAFEAPAVVAIEAGHDAWVVGDEAAVLIQFDAEGETARRFGLDDEHRHRGKA